MSDVPDLRNISAYVNVGDSNGRYARVCRILVDVLTLAKISIDEKHDVITDISDLLDGVQPSKRSGYTVKK